MRSILLVASCLCLSVTAQAQTHLGLPCQDQAAFEGRALSDIWTSSFTAFSNAHALNLTADQAKLVAQAIEFGKSENFTLSKPLGLNTVKGLLGGARQLLTRDQFSEILAGMGSAGQESLAAADVVAPAEIACACKSGAGGGPGPGWSCVVGCTTWGTGEWNGLWKRTAGSN